MVFPRASARWNSHLGKSPLRTVRSNVHGRTGRQSKRRTYASGGDGGAHRSKAFGGDLPWAITSTVVTVPCFWYLLQPQLHKAEHTEGHGHIGQEDQAEESGEGEAGEIEASEAGNSYDKGDDDQVKELQSKESGDEEGAANSPKSEDGEGTPDTTDNEGLEDGAQEKAGGAEVEGVRFKGASSANKEDDLNDTRTRKPDAKGGYKKRINSHYGRRQGVAEAEEEQPDNRDLAAGSKPPGDLTTQSGKQEGFSNTDTKHSTDVAGDPEKPTKGDSTTPETAKSKGTVDPRQPGK
ncbi:MAG: hypothetical protein Q9163_003060 [Psora crenata]